MFAALRRLRERVAEDSAQAALRREIQWHGRLVIREDGLERHLRGRTVFRAEPAAIVKVEAYLQDAITTDRLCLDIHLEDGTAWTIYEDLVGWDEAVSWLERLPAFSSGWRKPFVEQPFVAQRSVVYVRASQAHGGHRRRK